jgi:hypothetical protein
LLHTTEKQELEHTEADEDKIIIVLLVPSLRRCIMILSVNQRFSSTNSTCSYVHRWVVLRAQQVSCDGITVPLQYIFVP